MGSFTTHFIRAWNSNFWSGTCITMLTRMGRIGAASLIQIDNAPCGMSMRTSCAGWPSTVSGPTSFNWGPVPPHAERGGFPHAYIKAAIQVEVEGFQLFGVLLHSLKQLLRTRIY